MTKYGDAVARHRAAHGERFDDSVLDPRFIPFFNDGSRIGIRWRGIEKEMTGTVGVTTGWKPCFLLMRRSTDRGSSWTLGPDDVIVKVKKPGERSYRGPLIWCVAPRGAP